MTPITVIMLLWLSWGVTSLFFPRAAKETPGDTGEGLETSRPESGGDVSAADGEKRTIRGRFRDLVSGWIDQVDASTDQVREERDIGSGGWWLRAFLGSLWTPFRDVRAGNEALKKRRGREDPPETDQDVTPEEAAVPEADEETTPEVGGETTPPDPPSAPPPPDPPADPPVVEEVDIIPPRGRWDTDTVVERFRPTPEPETAPLDPPPSRPALPAPPKEEDPMSAPKKEDERRWHPPLVSVDTRDNADTKVEVVKTKEDAPAPAVPAPGLPPATPAKADTERALPPAPAAPVPATEVVLRPLKPLVVPGSSTASVRSKGGETHADAMQWVRKIVNAGTELLDSAEDTKKMAAALTQASWINLEHLLNAGISGTVGQDWGDAVALLSQASQAAANTVALAKKANDAIEKAKANQGKKGDTMQDAVAAVGAANVAKENDYYGKRGR